MNYHAVQLAVDGIEWIEKYIEEIEQIQEDIPESDVIFSRLEEAREKLISIQEILELIKG